MLKNDIEWDNCQGNVSDDRIKYIEEIILIKFPESYLSTIKYCDGGVPVKCDFSFIYQSTGRKITDCIGRFLPLNDSAGGNLLQDFLDPPEFYVEGLVPFAENGGGDYICFDYRQGKNIFNPQIVYWSHGAGIGKDVSFVANNFEEFINMLEEPQDK